ncbi:MAG: VWA domain-containing protein [Candidatus Longimicrobiales bacterium M2_2A_002]
MSFEHADLLWLAVALPAGAAVALWLRVRRRRRVARALGEVALLERLGAGALARTPWARATLLVGAALALGLAAAGPRWGLESVEEETASASLVLALDVSKSMLARDVAPNRLERQRVVARRVLRELPGDRIGMVAFAGRAYVLAPMTVDHSALQLYLDALDPEIVSQGGSSLASAIRQATDLARGRDETQRGSVVLITDGEELEDEDAVLDAAERAADAGIVVHTVGVGGTEGAPIPEAGPGTRVESYKRGPDGEIVITRLNESLLERVADIAGGRYVRLGGAGASDAVLRTLQGLERAEGAAEQRVRQKERYAWFALLALALLLADGVVAARGRREVARA